jgi:hypothetical protein
MVGVGEVIKGLDLCITGGEGIQSMRIGTCTTLGYKAYTMKKMIVFATSSVFVAEFQSVTIYGCSM